MQNPVPPQGVQVIPQVGGPGGPSVVPPVVQPMPAQMMPPPVQVSIKDVPRNQQVIFQCFYEVFFFLSFTF
jgi:hypothetical protein